jgi:hypothetical protein
MSESRLGPVLPAMSLVPARMTTTSGSSARTSARNRTSICGVVCPPMPRLMYGLPGKKPPYPSLLQLSVIESPMNTTRLSPRAGAPIAALASR